MIITEPLPCMQNTNGARESEASFETEDFYRKITELNNPNDFVLQISLVHRKTPQEYCCYPTIPNKLTGRKHLLEPLRFAGS